MRLAAAEPILKGAIGCHRNRYRSSIFLRQWEDERQKTDPKEIERRIGFVDAGLYNPETDVVVGEADRVARRLHRPPAPESEALPEEEPYFRARVLKEAVQASGRADQVDHCDHPKCVMHVSNALSELDQKGADFCMAHLAELKRRS